MLLSKTPLTTIVGTSGFSSSWHCRLGAFTLRSAPGNTHKHTNNPPPQPSHTPPRTHQHTHPITRNCHLVLAAHISIKERLKLQADKFKKGFNNKIESGTFQPDKCSDQPHFIHNQTLFVPFSIYCPICSLLPLTLGITCSFLIENRIVPLMSFISGCCLW